MLNMIDRRFLFVFLGISCWVTTVSAQPPVGRGGGAAEAARERVQSRLRAQVQQRTQAQVQQALQARAQSKLQARVQQQLEAQLQTKLAAKFRGRPEASVQQAAAAASRAAAALEFASLPPRSAKTANIENGRPTPPSTSAEKPTRNAARATRQSIVDTHLNEQGQLTLDNAAMAQLPPGFAKANDEALKAVFGQFDSVFAVERQTIAAGETPTAAIPTDNSLGNSSPTLDAVASATAVSTEADNDARTTADSPRSGGLGVLMANPQAQTRSRSLNLETRIEQAVLQRRAQISKLRDAAITSGNADLLARADQWELTLEAFVEARQLRVAAQPQQPADDGQLLR